MNDYTIPDEYAIVYTSGHYAGEDGYKLDDNPYDREAEYESWHFWNDGFFDGLKERINVSQ